MNSSVSLEDQIWFLRVCHHVPFSLYYSMRCSAWVCRLWLAVVLWSCVLSFVHSVKVTVIVAVTFTQCTLPTTQLHKTTTNHSLSPSIEASKFWKTTT